MAPGVLESIPCHMIRDPGHYRREMGDMVGLTASIRTQGLLHPVLVTRSATEYDLLDGTRRMVAVRELGWKHVDARMVEVESTDVIAIQCDVNGLRKRWSVLEAARIARVLWPLVQAAAETRKRAGVAARGESGETRLIVGRRVGWSHVSLVKAEYLLHHLDRAREQRDLARQAGAASREIDARAAQLEALVERLETCDHGHPFSITAAYTEARALLEGKVERTSTRRVVLPVSWTAENGSRETGEITLKLSRQEPRPAEMISALHAAIRSLASKADE